MEMDGRRKIQGTRYKAQERNKVQGTRKIQETNKILGRAYLTLRSSSEAFLFLGS